MAGSAQAIRQDFVYELKFYLPLSQAAALAHWARAQLDPDPFGTGAHADQYHVSSVYFDTERFDVLSRRGSYARSKYRLRRYGSADAVYLERKTKGRDEAGRRVYKRRSLLPLAELARLQAPIANGWSGQWFQRRLRARALRPACRIDYERLARVGAGPFGPLRLTLDQGLHAQRASAADFGAAADSVALLPQRLILELKFGASMPAVFKQLIREFAPRPEGISKYRLACGALGIRTAAFESEDLHA